MSAYLNREGTLPARGFIVDNYTAIFYLGEEKDEMEALLDALSELDGRSVEKYARWKEKQGKRVPSFLSQRKWENAKLKEMERDCVETWYSELLSYDAVISVGSGGKELMERIRLSLSTNGKSMLEILYCPIKRVVKDGKTIGFIDNISGKPYEGQIYRKVLDEYRAVETAVDVDRIAIVDDVVNSGSTIREIAKWMSSLYSTKDVVCFIALDLRKEEQQLPCGVISIYRVKEKNGGSAYLAADLIDEFRDLQEFLGGGASVL